MLYRDLFVVRMKPGERKDITKEINDAIARYGIRDGLCNVFLKGTTAGLMLNEDDRMLVADIEKLMDTIAPMDKLYQHPENAYSHIRSMLLGSTLAIPIANGQLFMGTWQSILLWEFDVEERERTIVITMIGG